MGYLQALYDTYRIAEQRGLVDGGEHDYTNLPLAPVYHSFKKAKNGTDKSGYIIEVTIDEDAEFVSARYLAKGSGIVYPNTYKSSGGRTSGIAPRPIFDQAAYVLAGNKKKHEAYLANLMEWADYDRGIDQDSPVDIVYRYVSENDVRTDLGQELGIDASKLDKEFIVFTIEYSDGPAILARNHSFHEKYIQYVENHVLETQTDMEKAFCSISGEWMYCVKNNPGFHGSNKLISLSNDPYAYVGRFEEKKDSSQNQTFMLGYRTSQMIHNMLNFLNEQLGIVLAGNDTSLISWRSESTDEPALTVFKDFQDIDNFTGEKQANVNLKRISGRRSLTAESASHFDDYFYILTLGQYSNGRVSVKYFRDLRTSEYVERLIHWYETTNWEFKKFNDKGEAPELVTQAPSIKAICRYAIEKNFSQDGSNKKSSDEKLETRLQEELTACIIDAKPIPIEIVRLYMKNAHKRQKYEKSQYGSWDRFLSLACSVFKKYKKDYENQEVGIELLEPGEQTLSYLYGRLAAVYQAIEEAATPSIINEETGKPGGKRATNVERLWNQCITYPESAVPVIEKKTRPYSNKLKATKGGLYVRYQRFLSEIMELIEARNDERKQNRVQEFDFILGYYAQNKANYTKKAEATTETDSVANIDE